MNDNSRVCLTCGRRWHARDDGRFTLLGLKLRRTARHAGWQSRWAHPRPQNRCPSCASTQVRSPSA